MMEIKKLTVKELVNECDERYAFAIQYGKEFQESKDSIGLGDLTQRSFGVIKEILMMMEGDFNFTEQLSALQKLIDDSKLRIRAIEMDVLQFVQELNYMKDEMKKIVDAEIELLSNAEYDEIAERAVMGNNGKSLFEGLEVYMQLRQLANEDITKIDKIEKMKYSDCLIELYTRNQLSKFQKNYERLSKRK